MKKTKNFMKAIPLAIAVCSSILVSTAKPASAFGWWQTDYLGRATISDNYNYWRSIGRIGVSTPPWNRNDICNWKYSGRSGVYGKAVSWWGRDSWKTNCYHRYWKWWW